MVLTIKKLYLFLVLFTILCQYSALAQTGFTATISPGSIGKNETAELRLMIDNARQVEEIIPPSLKDFMVLSGPNQESGMESINGVTRQYIGITYQLKPKATGKFTIGSAIARADGKTLRSNPVKLVVTKNPTGGQSNSNSPFAGFSPFVEPSVQSTFKDFILKKGENIAAKIDKNIFIKVEVSKPTCVVGEPVVVTYKLFTRLKSESNIIKNPSFNGFSVIDLLPPGNTYYSVEKLGGREYNVYTLRKAQLYPLQAGVIELESAEVENHIHFIKEEYVNSQQYGMPEMFRDFSQTSIPAEGVHDEKVTLQSKQAFITVKPLPEKLKPSFFKGAVGKFTMDAALEKDAFSTDDAGSLNITITGEGNMTMVIAPDINWPDGVEPYEPRASEQLNKLTVPVSGTKVFKYPFTVAKAGNYTIPAIEFSYFDTKENSYKTVTTNPLNLVISKGLGKRPVIADGRSTRTGREDFFNTIFTNRWMIVIPVAILILSGLFIWLYKDNKRPIPLAAIRPTTPDKNHVPPAENVVQEVVTTNPLELTGDKLAQQDSKGFYETLNKELRKFLSDKLAIPLATINKKSIADELDKKGLPLTTSLQIQYLLDEIEWQLYTPFAAEDKMKEMYYSANEIVNKLNTACGFV